MGWVKGLAISNAVALGYLVRKQNIRESIYGEYRVLHTSENTDRNHLFQQDILLIPSIHFDHADL